MNGFPSNASSRERAELDALLRTLGSAAPEVGLEERVLARLRAASGVEVRLAGVTPWKRWLRLEGWAPVAMAASMACILGGGVLMERVAPVVAAPHVDAAVGMGTEHAGEDRISGRAFSTAAARVEPAAAVRVGTRRGRASRVAHSTEQMRMESGAGALPVRRR